MPFKLKQNSWTQNGGRSLRSWIASSFQGTSKLREEDKQKKEWLKRNGEVLLRQRLAAFLGVRETFPLFSEQELKVATDNFDSKLIIYKDRYLENYKGILPDGRVVEIKRYRIGLRHTSTERIINEIVILSQLNHKNVVKLIGCCLETQLPLFVCEFFSKKTLSQLLYDADGGPTLSLFTRLHFAFEIASTLVYLHSHQRQSSYRHSFPSLSIVHAALSPLYILIDDENCSIKLTGFGVAKIVRDDNELQDEMFGVPGYIDPEFFNTRKLTDKSDVHGFGILLSEMLLGKRPSKIGIPEFFLEGAKEDRLVEILEPRIRNEAKVEYIQKIYEIICNCLKHKSKERPTMIEVAIELQQLRTSLAPTK